jgi:hypothetical protein
MIYGLGLTSTRVAYMHRYCGLHSLDDFFALNQKHSIRSTQSEALNQKHSIRSAQSEAFHHEPSITSLLSRAMHTYNLVSTGT